MGVQHLDEKKEEGIVNESVQQVAFADRMLLNKTDLVSAEEKQDIIDRVRSINKVAEIIETQYSKVDLKQVLGLRSFDLEKMLEQDPDFLTSTSLMSTGMGMATATATATATTAKTAAARTKA